MTKIIDVTYNARTMPDGFYISFKFKHNGDEDFETIVIDQSDINKLKVEEVPLYIERNLTKWLRVPEGHRVKHSDSRITILGEGI